MLHMNQQILLKMSEYVNRFIFLPPPTNAQEKEEFLCQFDIEVK